MSRSLNAVIAIAVTGLALLAGSYASAESTPSAAEPKAQSAAQAPGVLDFKMKSLAGKEIDLASYKGRVILIVNTASRCGNTPQYKSLEALYEKYGPKGFTVLGFPANNFGHQEPGTDMEITEFCAKNYGVKFDMFSKISVKGDDKAALYKFLTEPATNGMFAGEIGWNFEKFLISRDGQVVARFAPGTQPDAPEVIKAIEGELQRHAK